MTKQITKIKKILFGILLVATCLILYAGNSKIFAAGGPTVSTCALTGGGVVGSACYVEHNICGVLGQSPPASLSTLCSDLDTACNYITTSTETSECESQNLATACINSDDTAYCADVSSICSVYLPPSISDPIVPPPIVSESADDEIICTDFNSLCESSPTVDFCDGTGPSQGPGGSSADVDLCYDAYTGWTYDCGLGSDPEGYQEPDNYSSTDPTQQPGNDFSLAPVTSASFVPDSTSKDKNGNTEYEFVPGNNCYAATLIPSGSKANQLGWVEQSPTDCSTDTAFSTAVVAQEGYPLLPNLAETTESPPPNPNNCSATHNCIVAGYIDPLIRFLNIAVSLVAVIAIVISGIQYTTSRDNPEAVKAARKHILDALLGLIIYFLLWALLNFIIPGGA